jgi:hypothetical protein
MATPITLKNYTAQSFLEAPADFFKPLLDPGGGGSFASENFARLFQS